LLFNIYTDPGSLVVFMPLVIFGTVVLAIVGLGY